MSDPPRPRILHIHGGPGLNANPERHLLLPRFEARGLELALFEEPSAQRPDGPAVDPADAFAAYMQAARDFLRSQAGAGPVVVVGHSFGAIAAVLLSAEMPGLVKALVTLGAALDQATATRRLLRLAASHCAEPARAQSLNAHAENLQTQFDENAQQGLMLATEDTGFMQSYWCDPALGQAYLQHYTAPRYELDAEAFMAVRSSLNWTMPAGCQVPVTAIHGARDPLVPAVDAVPLLRRSFEQVEAVEFAGSAHYPHIEETDRFLNLLEDIVSC